MYRKITFLLLTFYSLTLISQELNLEKYKYIIVPTKFDFLKKADQYQTSSLVKFLFNKKGFTVFLDNEELPKEFIQNRCNALTAIAVDKSSLFTIKNALVIKDCFGKVVYESKAGSSKLKDYKRGYQEAIKAAFNTMSDFEFSYNPSKVDVVENVKEVETIVKKDAVKVVPTPKKPVKKVVVKQQENIDKLPILYAQPKDNGYQLVNTKPEVVFIILKTSKVDFYIIKNKSGTLYKVDNSWVAEYYVNGDLVKEKYEIKF